MKNKLLKSAIIALAIGSFGAINAEPVKYLETATEEVKNAETKLTKEQRFIRNERYIKGCLAAGATFITGLFVYGTATDIWIGSTLSNTFSDFSDAYGYKNFKRTLSDASRLSRAAAKGQMAGLALMAAGAGIMVITECLYPEKKSQQSQQ